jgi:hypothetical protein
MPKNRQEKPASVVAKRGERMIELKIRFWTDGLADEPDKIIPRHAWAHGVVTIESNKSHDIQPDKPKPFNSPFELMAAIEYMLHKHEVKLHLNTTCGKVLA